MWFGFGKSRFFTEELPCKFADRLRGGTTSPSRVMGDDATSEFLLVMALDWKTVYNEKNRREAYETNIKYSMTKDLQVRQDKTGKKASQKKVAKAKTMTKI